MLFGTGHVDLTLEWSHWCTESTTVMYFKCCINRCDRSRVNSPEGRNILMDFSQFMGSVPTQHREENGELRLVADSSLEN